MKSRTSFFNAAALRKDILRYSPIWALYTIFLLLVLFSEADYSREGIASDMTDFMASMAWVNLIYGGVCAAFLFMDLFNNRLCNALHAFPIRREGWLITHLLSGFLFSLVPNLLITGIGALMLWEYAYLAPIWLAISTMQFLFFFGTAVLAATCAGNLLGTVAVYGITHFITVLVYAVAQLLYQPLLYGVRMDANQFYRFFPLDQLDGFDYVKLETFYTDGSQWVEFKGMEGGAWLYVGICAAVGILAMLLACRVYRRRNLEAAGDFISLKPLAPLFILVCTIGAGAFLYMFSGLFGNQTYLFLGFGMIIGYFAGKMLLNRTIKVFGKKSLMALGVLVVVVGSSLFLTYLDPLGVTTYIPQTENIKAVYFCGADKSGYYYDFTYRPITEQGREITDKAEIANIQDFHEQLTNYRPSKKDGVLCDVHIEYKLKNGMTVNRYYEVGRDTDLGRRAGEYFSDMRYIFEVDDISVLYEMYDSVSLDIYEQEKNAHFTLTDPQEIAGLLDAIAADCEAKTMSQNWAFHKETDKYESYNVEFYVKEELREQTGISRYFHLQVYPESVNTINYMREMQRLHHNEQLPEDEPILDPLPE